jgi:hypothetical protein
MGGVDQAGGFGVAQDDVSGKGAVSSTVTATGGWSHTAGGAATATSDISGTTISSTASATAGGSDTAGATALATSVGDGSGGVDATAMSAPQTVSNTHANLISYVYASADGAVTGDSGTSTAEGLYGGVLPAFSASGIAVATGDAQPTTATTHAILTANANIAADFTGSPSFFSVGEVGGGHSSAGTASETSTSTVTTSVDLSNLSPTGDLILGLYDGDLVGSGVTSVSLTVSGNGVDYINDQNMTGAAAQALFTDGAFNLGALASSGGLNLSVSLTVVSDAANSGFYGDFILGDPPAQTAALHTLIGAMASAGSRSASETIGHEISSHSPWLLASQH